MIKTPSRPVQQNRSASEQLSKETGFKIGVIAGICNIVCHRMLRRIGKRLFYAIWLVVSGV